MANPSHSAFDSRRRLIIALLVVTILAAVLMVTAAVLLWKNGGDDGVVLKDNVVIYEEGSSPFTILASDADSVTVSSLDGLSADSVLAAGVTETTPYGLLRKAVSYEPVEGGYRIVTEQAALTDAIAECDVRVLVTIDEDENYRIDQLKDHQASPLVEQAFADDGWLSFEGDFGCPLFEKKVDSLSAGAWQRLEVAVRVDGGKLTFRLAGTLSMEVSIDGIKLEKTKLFDEDLRPFQFSIGGVPIVIEPNLSVEASLNGSAHGLGLSMDDGWEGSATASSEKSELEISGKIEKCFGFEYTTDNGLRPINEDRSQFPRPILNPSDKNIGLDAEGEVDVSFKALLYGVSGFRLSTGLLMQINAELSALSPDQLSDQALKLPGVSGGFAGTLSEKITLPISGSLVMEDLNVLGWNLVAGFDLELFNSGDAITLLDETQSFEVPLTTVDDGENGDGPRGGEAAGSLHQNIGSNRVRCTTKFPDNAPQLSFVHPADWECSSSAGSEMSPFGPHSALIWVAPNARDGAFSLHVDLQYLEWYGGDMWAALDMDRTAQLTKVANAAFAPLGEEAGSYVVAEATYPKDYSSPDDLTSELVLVPVSYLEQCPLSTSQDTNYIAFDFSGRAVRFYADADGLSDEQRQEAIDILASLRVVS